MPIPIERLSLTTPLTKRYAKQKAGGAFDDKNIVDAGVDPLFSSYQSATFQIANGFLTKEQQGISNFKNDGNNLSMYSEGLDTSRYSTSFPG